MREVVSNRWMERLISYFWMIMIHHGTRSRVCSVCCVPFATHVNHVSAPFSSDDACTCSTWKQILTAYGSAPDALLTTRSGCFQSGFSTLMYQIMSGGHHRFVLVVICKKELCASESHYTMVRLAKCFDNMLQTSVAWATCFARSTHSTLGVREPKCTFSNVSHPCNVVVQGGLFTCGSWSTCNVHMYVLGCIWRRYVYMWCRHDPHTMHMCVHCNAFLGGLCTCGVVWIHM